MLYILLAILAIIYIASATFWWFYMRAVHSKGGIWEHSEPIGIDVFIMFCPVLNTGFCILWLLVPPYKNRKRNLSKFFGVKK